MKSLKSTRYESVTRSVDTEESDEEQSRIRPSSPLRKLTVLTGPPVVVLIIVLAGWSLLAETVYSDRAFLLPPPWDVATAARDNFSRIVEATRITFVEAAGGFVAAIVVGLAIAVVMSRAKSLERALYPYVVLLQTVPIVAVAPIIVLWFGFEQRSIMIISFIISLFPIVNNSLLGLISTDRSIVDLFRMHDVGLPTEFWRLRLPSAAPYIVAGLRISAGLSVIGAIVGEFIIGAGGSEGGLGVKIIFAQARLQTDLLFALVAAATLLGFTFFSIVSGVGHVFLRTWHESARD
jgi:NitT/TauT family transport system permease protein